MIFASSLADVCELAVMHLKVTVFKCILQIPFADAYAAGRLSPLALCIVYDLY